jgi:hypothetical protein
MEDDLFELRRRIIIATNVENKTAKQIDRDMLKKRALGWQGTEDVEELSSMFMNYLITPTA